MTTRPSTLIDQFGKIDQMTCVTCHLTHGRNIQAETGVTASTLSRVEIAGIKSMLRPGIDREVCASCHGVDAARMYLYFHDPKKRRATPEAGALP